MYVTLGIVGPLLSTQGGLAIEELPGDWPPCDERCNGSAHDPDLRLVAADLELERTSARGATWWEYGSKATFGDPGPLHLVGRGGYASTRWSSWLARKDSNLQWRCPEG
jgi:hypothetical protein